RRVAERARPSSDGGSQEEVRRLHGVLRTEPRLHRLSCRDAATGGAGERASRPVTTDEIVAITQVVHLYGHIMDSAAWDRLGEVFAEDATFDITSFGGGVMVGLSGIYEAFSRGQHPPAHQVSNTYVEERDDGLHALSKLFGPDWSGRMVIGDYRD